MNGAAVTAMCVVAGLLVTGGDDGSLRLFNPTKGDCLQSFHDHKGAVMDIYAVRSYLVNQNMHAWNDTPVVRPKEGTFQAYIVVPFPSLTVSFPDLLVD